MKVLIADDDETSRHMLQVTISEWGHEIIAACDGEDAWKILQSPDAPKLAVLDLKMPGMEGIEVCTKLRAQATSEPPYVILLSCRESTADIIVGLHSGANDYVVKPYNRDELRARVNVGCRVVQLQQALSNRVRELEQAAAHIKQLRTLLPICCSCKNIRDDQDAWHPLEVYLLDHSDFRFSHDLCPVCLQRELGKLER